MAKGDMIFAYLEKFTVIAATRLEFLTEEEYWLDTELPKFAGKTNINDYYIVNGLEIKTLDQLSKKLTELVRRGDKTIILRLGANLAAKDILQAAAKVYKEEAPDVYEKSAGWGVRILYNVQTLNNKNRGCHL